MALSLYYNVGGPVTVHAQENESVEVTEKLNTDTVSQEGTIDFSSIKDNTDLFGAEFDASNINCMEKACTEDYSVNLIDTLVNTENSETVNDNPNDATVVALGTQVSDTVTTELEQRWYAFSVEGKTKFTAAMVMDDTVDFGSAGKLQLRPCGLGGCYESSKQYVC